MWTPGNFCVLESFNANSGIGGLTKIHLKKGDIIQYRGCKVVNHQLFRIFDFDGCQISSSERIHYNLEKVK